jgi:hypothetical protein
MRAGEAMASLDLKLLVGRLDDWCRRSLEGAAGLTLSRSHYNVEVEHWLLKLLEAPDCDVALILRHFEVDPGRLSEDLNRALDGLKTGNARPPTAVGAAGGSGVGAAGACRVGTAAEDPGRCIAARFCNDRCG